MPKQFLQLPDGKSLFQRTFERAKAIAPGRMVTCVGNARHRFLIKEATGEEEGHFLILEPVRRSSAASIACAALVLNGIDPHCMLACLPSDHIIEDEEAFGRALREAAAAAGEEGIGLIGIVPSRPSPAFGYIEPGPSVAGSAKVLRVSRFVEKPNIHDAQALIETGSLWNSGVAIATARRIIGALERHAPEVLAACRAALKEAREGEGEIRLNEEALAACETISFDHAVLEREANLVVVGFEGGWRDVGSWPEFGSLYPEREDGNQLEGPVVAKNCRNTLVVGAERPTVVLGLSGIIVVDADDGLLVSEKSQASELKDVLRSLRQPIDQPARVAQRVMRPWGHYEIIARTADFQIKRLSVNGNAILSLQYHRHRSEHWVVVKGIACITRGDETFELGPEESIDIPREAVHRLENRKQDPLELIEIAFGAYFGEDDIVRLEDRYGRR